MKTTLAIGALVLALVPAIPGRQNDKNIPPVPPPVPCDNAIVHEPLLIYEVYGSTLIAPYDVTLTVYADGSLKLVDAYATAEGVCRRAKADPRTVLGLQQVLARAGAFTLCDDTQLVTDVPLHTLTMLDGTPDAVAHTFSYWLGDGGYAPVDALLENFIATQF